MNEIEKEICRVVDVVIECCATNNENAISITKEEILGKSKKENANFARTMLAHFLHKDGFSVTTLAFMFNRSQQSVRNLIVSHDAYIKQSNAYRIANEQVKNKLNESK